MSVPLHTQEQRIAQLEAALDAAAKSQEVQPMSDGVAVIYLCASCGLPLDRPPQMGCTQHPQCAPVVAAALLAEREKSKRLREAINDLIVICESEHVAAMCGYCGGAGEWTQDRQPTMTPMRHKEGCVLALAKAALAEAGEE